MELNSSRVPILHDWLIHYMPFHWPPHMQSISRVRPRSETLIPRENGLKASCPKAALSGRISPNVVHDVGER